MSEAYKKFTAQDYAVIPFNAHKQYNFNSQSAYDNQLKFYNVSWTSESISLYSSASSVYGSDTLETVKYNQLDHLFYKDFKNDTLNRFGYNHYLTHKRELYGKAQILSIPAGLYGHEIKPGTFYISSSKTEIIDDSYGNLIVSGTNMDYYPSDIRKNVFRLDPIKGFKAYDLDTIPGYAVKLSDPQNSEVGMTKRFWRRGVENPNKTLNYTTNTKLSETDDSYYFNPFKYNKVEFKESKLGYDQYKYPSIYFDSKNGSHIVSPHNDKFNFNDEDFAISFWMDPKPVGYSILPQSSSIGQEFGGGIIYAVDSTYIYIISTTPIGRYNGPNVWEWGNVGTTVGNVQSGNGGTPDMGDGFGQTNAIINSDGGNIGFLGGQANQLNHNGYTDWYIPTLTEIHTATTNLEIFNPNGISFSKFSAIDTSLSKDSTDNPSPTGAIITNEFLTSTEADANNYMVYQYGSLTGLSTPKNIGTTGQGTTTFLPVRRFLKTSKVGDKDNTKRYIICKSGTQTIIPSDLSPGSQMSTNIAKSGSSQPLNIPSQPQFPFEIYLQSQSVYFARSDGDNTLSISSIITGSSNHPELHHILCQKRASSMEIYIDGNFITSASDTLTKHTQNQANLYIGSKGSLSKKDANNPTGDTTFYNGSLSCINIFNNSFNTASVQNISESVNASPYVGNIFYQNGFVTFTNQNKQNLSLPSTVQGERSIESPVVGKRLQHFAYESENDNPLSMVRNITLDFKDDGTKLYTLSRAILPANSNGPQPGNINPNSHIYQFDLPIPWDIHSADLDGNPAGAGSYLNSTPKALALDPSASYAIVSSSLKDGFCMGNDMKFKYDGSALYLIGNGYPTLSGALHPGNLDYPINSYYGAQENTPPGDIPVNNRVDGHIVEIPLTTPWDISSGSGGSMDWENAKSHVLDYTTWHSHIDGYNVGAIDPDTGNNIDENTPHFLAVRGSHITSFNFSYDGTKMYTSHDEVLENTQGGQASGINGLRMGQISDPFNVGLGEGLGGTYVIEEWILGTPWDISTIQDTGDYVHVDLTTDNSLLGKITTDISNATVALRRQKYKKVGTTLDLTTLISPEGYPIRVVSIDFNTSGTKMWLLSTVTSISLPLGVRFAVGGLGALNNNPHVSWDASLGATSPSADGEIEGNKLWEYDLLVPGDISTAQYNKSSKLGTTGGVYERSHPSSDISFANYGTAHASYTIDDTRGMRCLEWHPDGKSFFSINSEGRTINRISFAGNQSEDEPNPYKVQFQGSHMIWEHEYQCTIDEHEFNDTLNITARKINTSDSHELADFTTGSLFKPYITTVGLYDENNELLVVGKMGQPIRASDETDTTIILRWDS